jgi:hypothetical protein
MMYILGYFALFIAALVVLWGVTEFLIWLLKMLFK